MQLAENTEKEENDVSDAPAINSPQHTVREA